MPIETPSLRVGLKYPVNSGLYQENRWFAFLLVILPSGAGRRVWAKRLGITQDYSSDLQMLLNGAGNAPGNIRVWIAVGEYLGNLHNDEHDLLEFLYSFAEPVEELPTLMDQVGVEREVIAGVDIRCREIAADLRLVGGRL